jgi:hypothetical protein
MNDPVEEVGLIFGNVGLGQFPLILTHPVERGDYLAVVDEAHGRVLCQLDDLKRTSDLDLERVEEAERGGPGLPIHERLLGIARIVGYRDGQGIVKIPTVPFRPGEKVYRAEEPLIAEVLGLKHKGNAGAYIGLLRNHQLHVELDINQLVQRHVSVLAKTGGGKSYLLGVLIEELLRHKVTCVIIDPHGEYGSLRHPAESNGHERFGVQAQGFGKHVMEFSPDVALNPAAKPLTFSLRHIDPRDLLVFMGLSNVKTFLSPLKGLVEEVNAANPEYSVRDLVRAAERLEGPVGDILHERLDYLDQTKILGPKGTSLNELVEKGMATIVNLRGVAPDIQELVVARIALTLFDNRKKGKVPPLFLVIEEAHNFAPQQGTATCSRILKNIASEGRKFGLGLCVVTQRAARIDKSVLSQCNTQLILQVTNPLDLKAIAQSIEGLTAGMTDMIQSLPIGTALVTGGGYHTPLFCEVRPRATRHGGESVKIVEN